MKRTAIFEFAVIQLIVLLANYFNVINWQWYVLILPLIIWTLSIIVLIIRDLYIWNQNKIINNKK